MPELAEVAHYAARWNPGVGNKVGEISLHPKARVFRDTKPRRIEGLAGTRFLGSVTHGKRMLMKFSGNRGLEIHLGMSGSLGAEGADHEPGKHDHLCLHQQDRVLVFNDPRMFGRVFFHEFGKEGFGAWSAEFPPEILGDGFSKERLAGILRRRARTPVKALLLEQEFFPGVGNWMADEILWRARIDPACPAGSIPPESAAILWRAVREVCRGAMRVIAPDWSTPPASWLFRHRWKAGGHCPRRGCGRPLERAVLRGRTTCWCPHCQPG